MFRVIRGIIFFPLFVVLLIVAGASDIVQALCGYRRPVKETAFGAVARMYVLVIQWHHNVRVYRTLINGVRVYNGEY